MNKRGKIQIKLWYLKGRKKNKKWTRFWNVHLRMPTPTCIAVFAEKQISKRNSNCCMLTINFVDSKILQFHIIIVTLLRNNSNIQSLRKEKNCKKEQVIPPGPLDINTSKWSHSLVLVPPFCFPLCVKFCDWCLHVLCACSHVPDFKVLLCCVWVHIHDGSQPVQSTLVNVMQLQGSFLLINPPKRGMWIDKSIHNSKQLKDKSPTKAGSFESCAKYHPLMLWWWN